MVDIALLLLTPFLQLGLSYYASVATMLALLLTTRWIRWFAVGISGAPWLLVPPVVALITTAVQSSPGREGDVLRAGREGLIFLLMTAAARQFTRHSPIANPRRIVLVLQPVLIGLFLICVMQAIMYPRGVYFGIPISYFATDSGTLPDELVLMYGVLRPHATFQEPSYLAFVLLSYAVMLAPLFETSVRVRWLLALVVLTGLVSQSMAFIISFVVVILIPNLTNRKNVVLMLGGAGISFVLALLVGGDGVNDVFARLAMNISGSSADVSTNARIGTPLMVTPPFLADYLFGVPVSDFEAALAPYMPSGILAQSTGHNGAFAAIVLYGLTGVAMVVVYVLSARSLMHKLYLFAAMGFNGALFAQDKLVMILLTIAVSEAMTRYNTARKQARRATDRSGTAAPPKAGPARFRRTTMDHS